MKTYNSLNLLDNLKQLLSKRGDYAIARKDNKNMEFYEIMMFGELFSKIDDVLTLNRINDEGEIEDIKNNLYINGLGNYRRDYD